MKQEYLSEDESSNCCSRNGFSICLATLLIISLTCLGFVSYVLVTHYIALEDEGMCTEMHCVKSSAAIEEFIDREKDPCTDFHDFVCGIFMKTAYEKQRKDPLKLELDRLQSKINSYIVEPVSDDDIQPVVMQKRYFQNCLDEEKIDENNNMVFFHFFNEIGGWPLLAADKWNATKESHFDWTKIMIRAMQLGLPFDWFLDVDIHDNGHYLLKISQPNSCKYFQNFPSQEDRLNLMTDITKVFKGHNIGPMDQIYEILHLEAELIEICRTVQNDSLSIKQMLEFVKIWSTPSECRDLVTAITKKWHLYSEIAYHESYILKLQDLLKNKTKETIANYIGWKIIEYFAPYLSKPIRDNYMKYLNKISDKDVDRFSFCLQDTKLKFNLVSETMYIREYTTPSVKEVSQEMVDLIKAELKEHIESIQRMNNETKTFYINFYDKLETIVGGPDEIFEEDIFNQHLFIGQLGFSSYNILHMIVDWSQNTFSNKINMIGQSFQASVLNFAYMTNRGFGIFFNADHTILFLPATMLHGVMFNLEGPHYLNYGSLGSLIAKKLIEGVQLTVTNSTGDIDEDNEKCLINSITTFTGLLDAPLIVQWNYPDLVGRHVAYRAYQKFVEEHGEESPLVGLPYSPNELFWIKSSINWCYQDLPNEDSNPFFRNMLKYRIIETAKHSPYFGEDFNCDEGSRMNPEKKCEIN